MAIYMTAPYATGSATAAGYAGWIVLDGLQLDVTKSISSETGDLKALSSGVPRFSAFSVTKQTEDASSGLLDELVHGQTGHRIEIVVAEAGDNPKEYVRYILTDAMVSSYSVSGGGDGPTHEMVSFHYSEIEVAFTPHNVANKGVGKNRVAYNLSTGK